MVDEIIIHGVDVSECDFIAKETVYCAYSGNYIAYKGECGLADGGMCRANSNCSYKKALKQLARKTQECEELKAQLNDMACMDDDNVLCYPRQELKKECEKYEQTLFEIKIYCKTALCVSTSKNDINFIQMIIDIIDKAMRQNNE